MQRRVPIAVNEYYHTYNRGVEKRDIFLDDADYRHFLILLYICNGSKAVDMRALRSEASYEEIFTINRGEPLLVIGAYCLMPNHFHLLIKEIKEGGTTLFMRKLLTAYAMYFNTRHKHSGILFQGRFRSEHVDSDEYLHYLYAYIHLNPAKLIQPNWKEEGIRSLGSAEKFIASYLYSSYRLYAQPSLRENTILNKQEFPDYFEKKGSFERLHRDWLAYVK